MVKRLVGCIFRGGQSAAIEKDDLFQIGCVEMIRTIDMGEPRGASLTTRVVANVNNALVRNAKQAKRWSSAHPKSANFEELAYAGLLSN